MATPVVERVLAAQQSSACNLGWCCRGAAAPRWLHPLALLLLTSPLCACAPVLCARCPLQGGGLAAAHLHVARTVCRRAERAVTSLHRDGHVGAEVCVYLNRLSDFLFVAARYAAMRAGASETVYKKAVGRTERPLPAASAPAAAGTAGAGDGSVAPAAVAAVTGTA